MGGGGTYGRSSACSGRGDAVLATSSSSAGSRLRGDAHLGRAARAFSTCDATAACSAAPSPTKPAEKERSKVPPRG